LAANPPDEDPFPVDGADPHPLPIVDAVHIENPLNNADLDGNQVVQNNLHNEAGIAPNVPAANQQFGNNAFDAVINELEIADNIQENEQGVAMDDNSNITITASVSDGNLSNKMVQT
jgi:hypothetical protein